MKFEDFGLHPKLMEALKAMGFETPSPIQEQAIPLMMQDEDLIGQAQTGTGKTAAFGLPMLDRLLHHPAHARPAHSSGVARPFGLVMCPTRELAIQVCEQMEKMGQAAQLNIVPVYGGQEMEKQLRRFQKPVDVVVGTPGRIMDHMERGTLNLEHVQVAILDEADRMLDMGFVDDVVGILRHSPPTRQTALFSATMPREVLNIAYEFMKAPQSVNVTPPDHLTVEKISQYYVQVDARTRPRALRLLLQQRKPSLALVFCRTKRGAERVGQQLKTDGFRAKALHGDLTQKQRDEAMAHFREGKLHVMVATDIASRGLDVFDVSHVINYDLPEDHLTYVHRIGRTGRMGANGEAISFVFPDQAQIMAEWAKSIGTTIKELKVDGLPSPESGAMGGVPAAAPMGYGSSGFGGETQTHERRPYGSGFGHGRSSSFGQTGGRGFGEGEGRPHERRSFGSGFGRGREGGPSGAPEGRRPFGHGGERREGGFGRGPREGRSSYGSGFGGRGGGRGGPRDGGSGFGGGAGMGRSPVSPLTIKKIKERPIGAAKSHGHTRGGHQYAGRQD